MTEPLYLTLGVDETWRDAEGRPLGEGAVDSDAPMERRTCPWPGSRHQHANPMNVSALRQLSAHWDEALGAIAALRAAFTAANGVPATHWALWHLVETGLTWPAFLVHRKDGASDPQRLPPLVAVVYKLLKGVSPVVHHHAVCALPPASAGALHDWAEKNGKLIGAQEVCAGSEAQIRRLLGVLVEGDATAAAAAPVEPELLAAGLAFARFGLLRFLHRLARTVAVEDERPALAKLPRFAAVLAAAQVGPLSRALCDAAPAQRAGLLEPIAAQQGTAEALALAHVWDATARDLAERVAQIDRAFLAGCVPLCLALRRALGREPVVPHAELDDALIDRLCSARLRGALGTP